MGILRYSRIFLDMIHGKRPLVFSERSKRSTAKENMNISAALHCSFRGRGRRMQPCGIMPADKFSCKQP
jgi:hypothetical protein